MAELVLNEPLSILETLEDPPKGLIVGAGLYTLAINSSKVVVHLCFVTTVSRERARSS